MTDDELSVAERELVEAAVALDPREAIRQGEAAARFCVALRVVARERLTRERPGWEDEYRTLMRAHVAAEAKFQKLSRLLDRAGIDTNELLNRHYPNEKASE